MSWKYENCSFDKKNSAKKITGIEQPAKKCMKCSRTIGDYHKIDCPLRSEMSWFVSEYHCETQK